MRNLSDILLQHFKKGDKLHSPLFSKPLIFDSVDLTGIHCLYETDSDSSMGISFDLCGRYIPGEGTCVLYPDATELSWDRYREELPKGTPVMVKYNKENTIWHLAWYMGVNSVASYPPPFKNMEVGTECTHIIPVDKFNFNEATYPEYEDYGLASKGKICYCSENVRC